jgi:hypothetical protein
MQFHYEDGVAHMTVMILPIYDGHAVEGNIRLSVPYKRGT